MTVSCTRTILMASFSHSNYIIENDTMRSHSPIYIYVAFGFEICDFFLLLFHFKIKWKIIVNLQGFRKCIRIKWNLREMNGILKD